jgi:hypothetical protein
MVSMKKRLMVLTLAVVMMCSIPMMAAAQTFPDVLPDAWYYGTVTRLTEQGSIAGYPDGTFLPQGSITRAEFIKILVFATVGPAYANAGEHWATGVMAKAKDLQLVQGDEFADTWDTPILRQEIARLLSRAMEYVRKEEPAKDATLAVEKPGK